MTIQKPAMLRPGATIGVVAPSSPPDENRLHEGVLYLEKLGYRVVVGNYVTRRYGHLAGSDAERAADLNEMFARPDIDAIFCARGGYGVSRLLDRLDYDTILRNPKILVGYSDTTALQLALFSRTGLVSFSGPMVAVEFAGGILPQTEEAFWRMITEPEPFGVLAPFSGRPLGVVQDGQGEGTLVGGCLSLVANLLGTDFFPAPAEAVLFIEDIGEKPMHIDRHLANVRHSAIFQKLRGVITGEFLESEVENPDSVLDLDEILKDHFERAGIPVLTGLDYGHGDLKYTLPIGVRARLSSSARELRILEAAVRRPDSTTIAIESVS